MIIKKIFFNNINKNANFLSGTKLNEVISKFAIYNTNIYNMPKKFSMSTSKSKISGRGKMEDSEFDSGEKRFKPKAKLSELSFPQYFKRDLLNLYFPVNDELLIYYMFNIINSNSVLLNFGEMGYAVPMTIGILTLSSINTRGVIIVENDEDAYNILKISNDIKFGVVYIKEESQLELFKNELAKVIIINYNNFSDEKFKGGKIIDEKTNFFFLNIKNPNLTQLKSFLTNFLHKAYGTNHNLLGIGGSVDELENLKKVVGKEANFLKTSIKDKDLRNLAIKHYGMVVTHENCRLITYECINKYLQPNSNSGKSNRILVIFNKDEEIISFQNYIETRKGFLNSCKQPENLVFTTTEQCENPDVVKQYYRNFDILIEYKFVDTETLLTRGDFLNVYEFNQPSMITLFDFKQNDVIHEIRQHEICKIKITNLMSTSFLLNENTEMNKDKKQVKQQISISNPETEFFNKLESLIKEPEINSLNIDSIYNKVRKNEILLKLICQKFFNQNYSKLFHKNMENISLITGKSGFYTCSLTSETSKNLVDRYYITKFLLEEGICEVKSIGTEMFRVYESFDFVLDIPCGRYQEIYNNAENKQIKLKIISELPIIFFHEYAEYVNKN